MNQHIIIIAFYWKNRLSFSFAFHPAVHLKFSLVHRYFEHQPQFWVQTMNKTVIALNYTSDGVKSSLFPSQSIMTSVAPVICFPFYEPKTRHQTDLLITYCNSQHLLYPPCQHGWGSLVRELQFRFFLHPILLSHHRHSASCHRYSF